MNNIDGVDRGLINFNSVEPDKVVPKIDRSSIPTTNIASSTHDICIENVTCKPKEVLSFEALDVQKRINSKFAISEKFSHLTNALHYLHVTLLDLENASNSVRIPIFEESVIYTKKLTYRASYDCLIVATAKIRGVLATAREIQPALETISNLREACKGDVIEIVLMDRFKLLKDKSTRIKGMKEALMRPLVELQKVLEYTQELMDLSLGDEFGSSKDSSEKCDMQQELTSYINSMKCILEIGCDSSVYTTEGACKPEVVDEFFKVSKNAVDLKNISKGNFFDRCVTFSNKNKQLCEIISNYKLEDGKGQSVNLYHLALRYVMASTEIFINKLLLTKFHISEIASIELTWVFEELKSFRQNNSYDKISSTLASPLDCFKGSSKMVKMSEKMARLTNLLDKDHDQSLFFCLERFMKFDKTITSWCRVKADFNSLKSEVIEIKKLMKECNVELQKIIDQTKWESQEEIDQIKKSIEEFKAIVSPFLFVVFNLPNTLDDFVVEGKDGLYKKSKAKTLNHDTQMNIKDLLRVNFPKIEIVETIQPIIVVPTKKIEPVKKQPQKVKPEPKVFQTNRVDDILAELKDRGWVKAHYHGSHLIFKKEREIFTVPTNHSRVKDGLLSGLNRQIVEKEEKINHNGQAK